MVSKLNFTFRKSCTIHKFIALFRRLHYKIILSPFFFKIKQYFANELILQTMAISLYIFLEKVPLFSEQQKSQAQGNQSTINVVHIQKFLAEILV